MIELQETIEVNMLTFYWFW